jgi:hypothetical protein
MKKILEQIAEEIAADPNASKLLKQIRKEIAKR